MDILLTWSGASSHEIATFFHGWFPTVLPGIKPWISDQDIAKGRKWFPELMTQLDKTNMSITFVTPENVRSPWIYYEVGVIAAKLEHGIVCPYLTGVDGRSVKDTPLGQFQWTEANKTDTLNLLRSINQQLGDRGHDGRLLEGNFSTQWPKLKRLVDRIVEARVPTLDEITEVKPSIEEQLSVEARQLLLETVQDASGIIIYSPSMGGSSMQTNDKDMIEEQYTRRKEATWKAALNQLLGFDLVEGVGFEGEVFEVTRNGYELADLINSRNQ